MGPAGTVEAAEASRWTSIFRQVQDRAKTTVGTWCASTARCTPSRERELIDHANLRHRRTRRALQILRCLLQPLGAG